MAKKLYDKILERQGQLEEQRLPHEDVYKEVVKLIRPELSLWTDNDDNYTDVGAKRNLEVYTGVPEEALDNWSDGMQGNLVSSSLDWFRYTMSESEVNLNPEIRAWLQEVEQVNYSIFRESNFYSALGPIFKDAGSIGDTVLFMEKDKEENTIDFKSFHPREVFHSKNILHRRFKITAKEAVDKFGEDSLSPNTVRIAETTPFARVEFIHAIYKKSDMILDGEKTIDRAWVSIYIEYKSTEKKTTQIKGYNTKPYTHWAYELSSDSEYGVGIGGRALVDIWAINSCAKSNMKAQNLASEPSYKASHQLRGKINVRPGGFTYLKQGEEIEALNPGINYSAGLEREDRLALQIERRFNIDFFLLLARATQPQTATEVMEKTAERSILMAPKIGRMETSLLNPVHERVFAIGQEEGWYPPPPASLTDQVNQIRIEYLGPLAQAQKASLKLRQQMTAMQQLAPIIQLDPSAADWIDTDMAAKRIIRDNNLPEAEIRSDEAVAGKREERQQQIEAQQQQEQLDMMAKNVPNVNKTTEPGSPLEQMIG